MKAIAASIVLLSGAILWGFGTIARSGYSDPAVVTGFVFCLAGAGLLWREWMKKAGDSQG